MKNFQFTDLLPNSKTKLDKNNTMSFIKIEENSIIKYLKTHNMDIFTNNILQPSRDCFRNMKLSQIWVMY